MFKSDYQIVTKHIYANKKNLKTKDKISKSNPKYTNNVITYVTKP